MDSSDRRRWNRAASRYEGWASRAAEYRWAGYKRELFSKMSGRVLFLAIGTGLDIQFFPAGQTISAIDVSENMLRLAATKAVDYEGSLELQQMDVASLAFSDESFDQIFTSCTFCSVTQPLKGLQHLHRVLRPGGRLYMFEHTLSRWFPFNAMLHVCTPICRLVGPDMNRPTVDTVSRAGFRVCKVSNHFLDIVKSIEATKDPADSQA